MKNKKCSTDEVYIVDVAWSVVPCVYMCVSSIVYIEWAVLISFGVDVFSRCYCC